MGITTSFRVAETLSAVSVTVSSPLLADTAEGFIPVTFINLRDI